MTCDIMWFVISDILSRTHKSDPTSLSSTIVSVWHSEITDYKGFDVWSSHLSASEGWYLVDWPCQTLHNSQLCLPVIILTEVWGSEAVREWCFMTSCQSVMSGLTCHHHHHHHHHTHHWTSQLTQQHGQDRNIFDIILTIRGAANLKVSMILTRS